MSTGASGWARLRDAVLGAVLPPPGPAWPALSDLDLGRFWRRFAETAPIHLRLGFVVAVWVLGAAWPRLSGSRRALPGLDPARRDEMVARASTKPLLRELVELVKMVAALAYFDDPAVAALVRGKQ